jgi:hypothetical protein
MGHWGISLQIGQHFVASRALYVNESVNPKNPEVKKEDWGGGVAAGEVNGAKNAERILSVE